MLTPALPIPAPMRGTESDTWAASTIKERLPEIVQRTLAENEFAPPAARRLEILIADIPHGPIRPLQDDAPDADAWQGYVAPYAGQNWLEPPWFFTETYFYRRILEATGYFGSGLGRALDPFAYQKRQGLATSGAEIERLAAELEAWRASTQPAETCAQALAVALWGNQADLSLWPAGGDDQPQHADGDAADHLLVDEATAVSTYLFQSHAARIDILADNAGFELVADLCLVDYLLGSNAAPVVHLHLKQHPTFVSDALAADVAETVAFLDAGEAAAVQALGARLTEHLRNGRLLLRDHPFWTSPLAFWEMPGDVRADLAQSHLIISKGDANYRRLLGDRHWPYTTPFEAIMAYTPAPLVALRTLKAELAAGLTPAQITRLDAADPQWMVNGRWGVIQFARPTP